MALSGHTAAALVAPGEPSELGEPDGGAGCAWVWSAGSAAAELLHTGLHALLLVVCTLSTAAPPRSSTDGGAGFHAPLAPPQT